MGSFGQIRKKSFFRFCRPILDIFGFTLLKCVTDEMTVIKSLLVNCVQFFLKQKLVSTIYVILF